MLYCEDRIISGVTIDNQQAKDGSSTNYILIRKIAFNNISFSAQEKYMHSQITFFGKLLQKNLGTNILKAPVNLDVEVGTRNLDGKSVSNITWYAT